MPTMEISSEVSSCCGSGLAVDPIPSDLRCLICVACLQPCLAVYVDEAEARGRAAAVRACASVAAAIRTCSFCGCYMTGKRCRDCDDDRID